MSQPQGDRKRDYAIAVRDHHLVITPTHRMLSGIDLKDPAFDERNLRQTSRIILDLSRGRMVNHDPLVQLDALGERHRFARSSDAGDVCIVSDKTERIRTLLRILNFNTRIRVFATMDEALQAGDRL